MKSGLLPICREAALGDGDDLQARRCRLCAETLAQLVEISRPVAFADRLEHLDRGDAVEGPVDVAIVLQPQVSATRSTLPASRASA